MQSGFKEAVACKTSKPTKVNLQIAITSDGSTSHEDQNTSLKSDDDTEVVPYSLSDRMGSF